MRAQISTVGMGSVVHAAAEVLAGRGTPLSQWPQIVQKHAVERMLEGKASPAVEAAVQAAGQPSQATTALSAANLPDLSGDSQSPSPALNFAGSLGTRSPKPPLPALPQADPATLPPVDTFLSQRTAEWVKTLLDECHANGSQRIDLTRTKGLRTMADVLHDGMHHRVLALNDAWNVFHDLAHASGHTHTSALGVLWTDRGTRTQRALDMNRPRATIAWLHRQHEALMRPEEPTSMPFAPDKRYQMVLAENRPHNGRGAPVWADTSKKGAAMPTPNNAIAWAVHSGITLAYDEFSSTPYVYGVPGVDELNDRVLETWWLAACRSGLHMHKNTFKDVLIAHAYERTFDSLREELLSYAWDGVPRLDTWVVDVFGCEDTELNRVYGRKWLIGAVARGLDPGAKMDHVLVLGGKQNLGKSTAFAAIAGPGRFSDNVDIAGDAKRVLEETSGIWIAELAELAALNKHDAEKTIGAITRRTDVARKAYERMASKTPRRFVMGGTTNLDSSYISSAFGNRRYWPLDVTKSDVGALMGMREQLLAEAVEAHYSDELPMLPDHLHASAEASQEAKRADDPWEETLRNAIGKVPAGATYRMTLGDALAIVGVDIKDATQATTRRITPIMQRLGATRRQIATGERVFTNHPRGTTCTEYRFNGAAVVKLDSKGNDTTEKVRPDLKVV